MQSDQVNICPAVRGSQTLFVFMNFNKAEVSEPLKISGLWLWVLRQSFCSSADSHCFAFSFSRLDRKEKQFPSYLRAIHTIALEHVNHISIGNDWGEMEYFLSYFLSYFLGGIRFEEFFSKGIANLLNGAVTENQTIGQAGTSSSYLKMLVTNVNIHLNNCLKV